MKTADTIVADIHAIRKQIDEETDGMTSAQISEYYRKNTAPIIKKYGFKTVTVDEVRGYSRTARE
ncbi:MAG: hypothetical protein LBH86_06320 [Oscillospiraceae bacterium]|jgi:hypothetical protein|nr:hypothetical protein [Oscillospiraceae bacterium]